MLPVEGTLAGVHGKFSEGTRSGIGRDALRKLFQLGLEGFVRMVLRGSVG